MASSTHIARQAPTTCRSPGTPRGTMLRIRSKHGIRSEVPDEEIFVAVFRDNSAAFDMAFVADKAAGAYKAYQDFLATGLPTNYELPERIIRASRPGSHQPSLERLRSI